MDKEKPLRELAFTSTANLESLLPTQHTQAAHLWQGRWRHERHSIDLGRQCQRLKPAAKVVLIQLADFHNIETGQCNPSAKRMAYECEMGRATLFRHMATLEQCGLVTRHARGNGDGGRGANQYELHLDINLGPSSCQNGGGNGTNSVSSQNETGRNVSKRGGKSPISETGVVLNRDTNLTTEPVKEPPTCRREAVMEIENSKAEKVLAAYPEDKIRDRKTSLHHILAALREGVNPDDLENAAAAYTRSRH